MKLSLSVAGRGDRGEKVTAHCDRLLWSRPRQLELWPPVTDYTRSVGYQPPTYPMNYGAEFPVPA